MGEDLPIRTWAIPPTAPAKRSFAVSREAFSGTFLSISSSDIVGSVLLCLLCLSYDDCPSKIGLCADIFGDQLSRKIGAAKAVANGELEMLQMVLCATGNGLGEKVEMVKS